MRHFVNLALFSIFLILFFLILGHFGTVDETLPADMKLSWRMSVYESDVPLSSVELKTMSPRFSSTEKTRISSLKKYLYIWLDITNSGSYDSEIILANLTRNYYVELLRQTSSGVVRIYRQGDIVSVSESPVRHHRTAFPLLLPADTLSEYILEYHGPRGIVADPRIFSAAAYVDVAARDRAIAGIITGFFLALILFNFIAGIAGKKADVLAVAAFISAEFLFFLRQSRILLLLINPMVYPEWLFPLTITISLFFGTLLGYVLLREYLFKWSRSLLAGTAVPVFILTVICFFAFPYVISDILNILSLLVLGILVPSIVRAVRAGNRRILLIVLSFIPWIGAMFVDIVTALAGVRVFGPAEYRAVFGLLIQLVLITIIIQMSEIHERRRQLAIVEKEAEKLRLERGRTLTSLTQLKSSVLLRLSTQLRMPLDALISSAYLLLNEYNEPGIVAGVGMIVEDAQKLRQQIGDTLSMEESELEPRQQPRFENFDLPSSGRNNGKIWIYDDDETNIHFLFRNSSCTRLFAASGIG